MTTLIQSLESFQGRDLLDLSHLTREDILGLFRLAHAMKRDPSAYRDALAHRSIVLIFEKPSLRTRLTFDVGISNLGGHSVTLDHSSGGRLGERESIKDYGRNLERWCQAVVARVYSHDALAQLAEHCDRPVINALSDRYHPCQSLADLFTLWEPNRSLDGVAISYVGDGNNVCHSLMEACAILGVPLRVVTPEGYEPLKEVADSCTSLAARGGGSLALSNDLGVIRGSTAVYTDVWTSMGQSTDGALKRQEDFTPYQVNAALIARASEGLPASSPRAAFMHCLPAKRGVEVTDDVIDGVHGPSLVYDQAENRMHAQNALLTLTLARR